MINLSSRDTEHLPGPRLRSILVFFDDFVCGVTCEDFQIIQNMYSFIPIDITTFV